MFFQDNLIVQYWLAHLCVFPGILVSAQFQSQDTRRCCKVLSLSPPPPFLSSLFGNVITPSCGPVCVSVAVCSSHEGFWLGYLRRTRSQTGIFRGFNQFRIFYWRKYFPPVIIHVTMGFIILGRARHLQLFKIFIYQGMLFLLCSIQWIWLRVGYFNRPGPERGHFYSEIYINVIVYNN